MVKDSVTQRNSGLSYTRGTDEALGELKQIRANLHSSDPAEATTLWSLSGLHERS